MGFIMADMLPTGKRNNLYVERQLVQNKTIYSTIVAHPNGKNCFLECT